MKTAGRITATLVALLCLYLLGYWFLIKKNWAGQLLGPYLMSPTIEKVFIAIHEPFEPIQELDRYLTEEVPARKFLTGHWRSDSNSDFVTLSPNGECHFQLGQFSFKSQSKYERSDGAFILHFPHQEHFYKFEFGPRLWDDVLSPAEQPSLRTDQARVYIRPTILRPLPPHFDYEATLTKHLPNVPAP